MQISSTPLKWTIPFATNDSAKVEIPATTSDPTRFSLSLGSPPLTGQPPETGGVPPQLEDFNGAMNQVSRITWWAMGGGPFPFDGTWSADPNVNGYANGAQIPTADGQGRWISVVDNNTVNPDTIGTNWVPGFAYGLTALTGIAGGTTTLTPAQAIKRSITIAGALTSNSTIILPTWLQEWTITNNTTGAFTVTVKTAAGSGVVIPQNSIPTRVRGDGTNITQLAENIAPGVVGTSAAQLNQLTGVVGTVRNSAMLVAAASATATFVADEIIVETALGGAQYKLASFSQNINLATTGAGGMDTGTAPVSGFVGLYAIYNPTTGATALLAVNATAAVLPEIYGGANLPAGYKASALVSVWSTTAAGLLDIGTQRDRTVSYPAKVIINSNAVTPPIGTVATTAIPKNARSVSGSMSVASSAASSLSISLYPAGIAVGQQSNNCSVLAGQQVVSSLAKLLITIPQTVYWSSTNTAGTPTFGFNISSYDF